MTRKLPASLLAACISLVAVVLVAEGLLQLLDIPPAEFSPWVRADDTAYGYASGLKTRMRRAPEYDISFETNSMGLRDDEISSTADSFRILLLGDSFTSGYGVARGSVFADLLETALTQAAGRRVDVINAGVGGYEIVHQIHYYLSRGRALAPDLVVYALYLGNDICRNHEWQQTRTGLRSVSREFPVRPRRDIKLVALLRQARWALRQRRTQRQGQWVPFDDYLTLCERELGEQARGHYRRAAELLERLREVVTESDAEFVVAPFSFRTAIEPVARGEFERKDHARRYDLDRPEREILAMLEISGIETINLNVALRAYFAGQDSEPPPLYFEIDGHFNERGHRIVADALAAELRPRVSR